MQKLSKEILEKVVKAKSFKWFEDRVNIIGVRTKDLTPNVFNDFITISYKKNNTWIFHSFEATTDPGLYWLNNPMNVSGTAIVVPNQYLNVFTIGLHNGYEAFVQINPISVYRDNNRDNYLNMNIENTQTGKFGINLHRSHITWLYKNFKSLLPWIKVNKYSAGCQVLAFSDNLTTLLLIAKESKQTTFDYTLLTEDDIEKYGK